MTAETLDNQRKATHPLQSAWVAANAGSGKTHVLVERIARLLLSGSPPGRLLCLTFTRAAASEMSVRLFKRLGEWTLMSDDRLSEVLYDLTGDAVTPDDMDRARRLFADALESPGGLRIQTIHAFCERLLKRFPLEAGVVPQFSVLDEQTRDLLLNDAKEQVLSTSALHDPVLGEAIQFLSLHAGEETFDELLRSITSQRSWIEPFVRGKTQDELAGDVWKTVGLVPGFSEAQALDEAIGMFDKGELRRVAAALTKGTPTDVERAGVFARLAAEQDAKSLDGVLGELLTAKGEVLKRLATKGALNHDPGVQGILEAMAEHALRVQAVRKALFVAQTSSCLLHVGREILDVFREAKARRAMLDYDDLIERTSSLFESPGAAWVLFKLDGGIDHILVDEAQDTSPSQWKIITPIATEFFAGLGAERPEGPPLRTIFAVGDVKQSIMSFQGAQPRWFIETRDRVKALADGAMAVFERVELKVSFRTAPAILKLVDAVLEDPDVLDSVAIGAEEFGHEAQRKDMPGLVDLWPTVKHPESAERVAWDAPFDRVAGDHPAVILAAQIAERIRQWLAARTGVHDKSSNKVRPISAGDIMILVRRRDLLAEEIIRQLKRLGIPVAGADRLKVSEHIAVMDLVALGRFVLMPDDDLTLATVLKGPLCGLGEEDLFELAHDRGTVKLWPRLRERARDSRWKEAHDFLDRVWGLADQLQPFEFYSSILCEMDGWRKILSRLGTDAADPVEEFLNAALDFGRSQTPSLEAFLHAIETTDSELKRDQDRSEGAVRVLTVHASKGLEAPVVILPDTWTTPQNGKFDKVLLRAGDVPLWKVSTGQDDPVRAMARQQDQIERMREYQRLLYVALTRARDQLHVCGYEGKKAPDDQRWYRIVEDAMDRLGARSVEAYGDTIKRLGELPAPVTAPDVIVRKALVPAKPDWVQQAAQPESVIEQVAPSRAGVKRRSSSPGGKGEGALERGLAVHRILDRIAQAAPDSFGSIATNVALSLIDDTQAVQAVVREALAVRREPSFAHLFGPGSHGELPVRGIVSWRGGKVELSARIDRVLVTATDVTIIEFKTDRVVPQAISAIPSNYITQLALYRRALSAMFPGRSVACGIIWTVQPVLTLIPPEHLHDVERVLDPPVHAS